MNAETFTEQLIRTKQASVMLARLSGGQRTKLVKAVGTTVAQQARDILAANERDLGKVLQTKPGNNDRLALDHNRIASLVTAACDVAEQTDPIGHVLLRHAIAAGDTERGPLQLKKVTVPLGVIGMIYESRPNVTFDAAIMALKSGNAIVLRGGSEAYKTNQAIVAAIHGALQDFGLDKATVTLMSPERELVQLLLAAEGLVDVLIPRGSQQLIDMVRKNATVPVIETGAGVCHTYVAADANLDDAVRIIINAKTQRPTVCNALDTIVIDQRIAKDLVVKLAPLFKDHNVTVWADEESWSHWAKYGYVMLHKATDEQFGHEFIGYDCSIKTVSGLDEALDHIKRYSSRHTEVIVSRDAALIARFINEADAAVVMSNASSRFTDGAMFGLGAEVGISTQKLHARGPFGIEKLVTEKWIVTGDGHVRN